MSVKFYDKVYVRAAGVRTTTISRAALASSWNLLPSGAKLHIDSSFKSEKDVVTGVGDGTEYVGSEAAVADLQFVKFSGADVSTIRGAIINQNIDLVVYDSNTETIGWGIFNTSLYPTLDVGSGKEPILKIEGKKRHGSDIVPSLTPVTLTA